MLLGIIFNLPRFNIFVNLAWKQVLDNFQFSIYLAEAPAKQRTVHKATFRSFRKMNFPQWSLRRRRGITRNAIISELQQNNETPSRPLLGIISGTWKLNEHKQWRIVATLGYFAALLGFVCLLLHKEVAEHNRDVFRQCRQAQPALTSIIKSLPSDKTLCHGVWWRSVVISALLTEFKGRATRERTLVQLPS